MIYRFAPFEIDTGQVELRREGVRVAVEPRREHFELFAEGLRSAGVPLK